jgi:lycopene cyclase domain-containing protein
MERALYLLTIVVGIAGVTMLARRYVEGIFSTRLVRAVVVTVSLFLLFDALGAWRGWFASNPHLNILIVPPGIPLEEPVLLSFLTFLSLALWQGARRTAR